MFHLKHFESSWEAHAKRNPSHQGRCLPNTSRFIVAQGISAQPEPEEPEALLSEPEQAAPEVPEAPVVPPGASF